MNRTVQSPIGRRLLWEIHRLRKIVLLADQLERSVAADPASLDAFSQDAVIGDLRQELDELPWVAELRPWRKGKRV